MISQYSIMEAIRALAAEKLPELQRIYIDLAPVDFLRPSLLVAAVTSEVETATRNTVSVTSYFTLTVFDETDDYGQSGTERLLDWQSRVLELFRQGYLRVGNRSLAVWASTGGRDWDKAFIDVQLSYQDTRDETPDTTPMMGAVDTNMRLKG